jgi:putative oxidoreductase
MGIAVLAAEQVVDADAVNLGTLIVRVVIGVTMAAHGYGKFFRGGRIAGTGRWFDSMGMRPGKFHALLAASTEVGAGLLFALGLFTSLAALGFVALMVVAGWTVHRANGFFIVGDGWEYNFVLAVIAIGVATIGPGEYSLDWQLELVDDFDGLAGLLISAVGGVAAAVGQLALFYRPPDEA